MNASTLIHSLVDMVSKNGNLLLNVGPKADGTIDVTEMVHLLEAGKWIKANAEAIFNTTFWFVIPGTCEFRFTQTILLFDKPTEQFDANVQLPILSGDIITIIGPDNGLEVAWEASGEGITISVPSTLAETGKYCWYSRSSTSHRNLLIEQA